MVAVFANEGPLVETSDGKMITQQNGTAVFYASYSYIIAEMSDERERWRDRQVAKDRGLSGY